jgi:hypothetical protein
MNKTTGELVTYSQANKAFYSIKRSYLESIFDEYEETDILSNEEVEFPNFLNVLAQ